MLERAVEMHYKDPDGVERVPAKTFRRSLVFVVLRHESRTVVAVQRGVREGGMPEFEPGAALTTSERWRFPRFFRLQETHQQITDVQAVADKDDNLSIQISHTAGQIKKIRLDANRNVLPE